MEPDFGFFTTCLGVVPLAAILGKATESAAVHTGPRAGGLLNATLGNAAELIIAVFAIQAGLLDLVKASITGSILGNILFVLGGSLLTGGLRNGQQCFDRGEVGMSATMLFLAVISLAVPAVFSHAIESRGHIAIEYLSLGVAAVMIILYVLMLAYAFFSQQPGSPVGRGGQEKERPRWTLRASLIVLAICTVFIAWLSEILVGAVEPVVEGLGWTEFFLGIVIVPLVGNIAEHFVAVEMAYKDKMDLSLSVSLGSSMQVALFVAPVLIFVSLLLGNPMDLIFNSFELVSLGAGVIIAALISLDGKSNWLEGAQLLAVYLIVALAFYYLP